MEKDPNFKSNFFKICYTLDWKKILLINKTRNDSTINNVVIGLDKECCGILQDNDSGSDYSLIYINHITQDGYIMELSTENPYKDHYTLCLSFFLADKYPHINSIDIFNSFQERARSYFEKMGYLTISSLERMFNNSQIIASGVKGIIHMTFYDKLSYYIEYMNEVSALPFMTGNSFIYLMLNQRNNTIKMGHSKYRPAKFREKTLQSQEPEVDLITYWVAPKPIEIELHREFKAKRVRGEWFLLTLNDLKMIKEKMSLY